MEQEQINNLISGWIVQLKMDRKELSIKDFAQILGGVFDDLELESLIKEIKNISINI